MIKKNPLTTSSHVKNTQGGVLIFQYQSPQSSGAFVKINTEGLTQEQWWGAYFKKTDLHILIALLKNKCGDGVQKQNYENYSTV